jgi:hypothetical protein
MKDLLKYCEDCTQLVASVFKSLTPSYKQAFPSMEFLTSIAQIFDLILVLDSLKNAKASLNNDFSMYKRFVLFMLITFITLCYMYVTAAR